MTCECGCGQATELAQETRPNRGMLKGEPNRFLRGHSHTRHLNVDAPHPPDPPLTAAHHAYAAEFDRIGRFVLADRLAKIAMPVDQVGQPDVFEKLRTPELFVRVTRPL